MTQKELLYVEDAIGHESSIVSICEDISSNLEDEDLIQFMNEELEKHKSMKENLLNLLEGKIDE